MAPISRITMLDEMAFTSNIIPSSAIGCHAIDEVMVWCEVVGEAVGDDVGDDVLRVIN